TGNPAPTFSLTAGSLPPGISISPAGVLAGTPSVSGTFAGTVSAGNGTDPTVSQDFAIAITDAAVATDTPTMPSWGLAVLAMALILVSFKSLPKSLRL
ncbi:MAG TPA: putative Ig domain-containing protein, partial [Candidatus Methylacidiphilales bacterium]